MASTTRYGLGLVLALHGLVHVWYVALSREWVDHEEPRGWNGESWLLSGVLPGGTVLALTSVLYGVVAVGFVVGGVGFALSHGWAAGVLVGSAVLSTVVIVVMWDGRFDELADKGGVGLLVNAVVLGWLLLLR